MHTNADRHGMCACAPVGQVWCACGRERMSSRTALVMPRPASRLQIIPINSTPGWLLALTGVFCAIGPVVLAGFFIVEKVIKKD